MTPNPRSGHGHVFPNLSGTKVRCGGPALCDECTRDLIALRAIAPGDILTLEDALYIVARLRKEAEAKLDHADALEAWAHRKFSSVA